MEDTLRNREDRFTLKIIKGFTGSIAILIGLLSIATSYPKVWDFIMNNLSILGVISLVVGIALIFSFKRKK